MRKNYLLSFVLFFLFYFTANAQVVINEVYGGGGNSGATYKNDFIELYNNSSSPVSLTGWSIQYASATGTTWQKTDLTGTIPANGYYLIQEAQGAGGTLDLPTPDVIGTIAMSGTAGKVALVNNTTLLSGCPAAGTYIDLVGFGTTANCFEGGGPTPAPSNTNAVQRNPIGNDTQNNNTDFATALPSPSNTSTGGGTASETASVAIGANGAEPATNGSFTISLSAAAPAGGITVTYTLSGSASAGLDYTDPQAGTVTIPEGATSSPLVINVLDDANFDPSETVQITLQTVTAPYILGTSTATISIADDEVPPPTPIFLTLAPYTQDFNTLEGVATTGSTVPNGWLFLETGSGANTTYGVGTGSSNAGNTYSFGASGSNERAFGGLQSGSVIPSVGAGIINNTGTTITRLGITFTGEQWRLGTAGRADRLDFQYSLDATNLGTGTWIDVDGLDFISPTQAGTAGALDGNLAANRSLVSVTINGIAIPDGATFHIRWNDFNASGADDGLAIDDVTIEANPVDLTAPVVTTYSPANGSTNVSTNGAASISFNEPVQKGTGTITLRNAGDNSVITSLDVTSASVSVNGNTVTFPLVNLPVNTTIQVEISNGALIDLSSNPYSGTSGNDWTFTTGTTFFAADFNTCTSNLSDGFTQYSVTGAITWACTTFGRDPNNNTGSLANGVQINGFSGGTNVPNVDWLISPAFDLTGTTYPLLSFWSRAAFNGKPLQLKVSTDYTGGDPALATWTDLNGKFPAQASNVWTLSENINLTAYKQTNVHIAFVYTSTDDDGARWTLDDLSLLNSPTPPPPSLTLGNRDVLYPFVPAGQTAEKAITFIGNDLTGDVTLDVTGDFLLSKDANSFSSSLTYTQAEANDEVITVYVRFAPGQNNEDFTGLIHISTSGLLDSIGLKGTSIDPATTLEVVNWNIEWFGSTANGPTNENQQQQNVQTILQNIGADVYGLVEVVDENRLAQVVAQMPGYAYVVCDYGSHTNPNAPNPGPLSEAQKEAFVYKTSVFSNITTEPLLTQGINSAADISNPAYNYWASGRFPYMMTADVTLNCITKRMRFILVHAKANTSPTATSYERRKRGADTLYQTLTQLYPEDPIIILGDFNDDLDQSITAGFTTTSWNSFTDDVVNFEAITKPLSLAGKKSTVSYNDVIDHVVVSNDLLPYYIPNSAALLSDVAGLVTNYGSTTTDHYPAFSRYIFRNTTAPTVGSCNATVQFCANGTDTYTVPAFVANDDCDTELIYTYTITGATERSGNANDASGLFNIGVSVINWTATDSWGNSVTCQTTVTVNEAPSVLIPDVYVLPAGTMANTVYIGYAPASTATLTASAAGGTAPYGYSWSTGSTNASIQVSPTTNTQYKVTITDANGCQAMDSLMIQVKNVRGGKRGDKAIICYKPTGVANTLEVFPALVPLWIGQGAVLGSCSENGVPDYLLKVSLAPNPTVNQFRLNIQSNNPTDPIVIRVRDIFGRLVELRQVPAGTTQVFIGQNYHAGLYFIEVIQGPERVVLRGLKLR